jgi:hypothetical protein
MSELENKTTAPEKPPREMPTWLRAFIRWGLVILVAFALGAALITFGFYLPLQQDYLSTKADLEEKETLLAERETELAALTSTSQTLQQELDQANLRAAILNALSAVQAARLAVAEGNQANATLLIANVVQALDELGPMITDKTQSEAVAAMELSATQAQATASSNLAEAGATLAQINDALRSMLTTLP